MTLAPPIRKQLLTILNTCVLPQLQAGGINQVLAEAPYDFREVPHTVCQEELLPDITGDPLDVQFDWKEVGISARRMSQLSFVYAGASQERVGVTFRMARLLEEQGYAVPAGLVAFRAQSPAAFYVPERIPHSGRYLGGEEGDRFGILVAHFTDWELLLRVQDTTLDAMHILRIRDDSLRQMELAYAELLRKRAYDAAARYLYQLMERMAHVLEQSNVTVSNSAWPAVSGEAIGIHPQATPRNVQLCYRAIDYILFHLDKRLTLEELAQVCQVTPQHLSAMFVKTTGVKLMSYAIELRLHSAELMLACTNESIGDVARLCGFSSIYNFTVIFKRKYGISPRQYRQGKRR